MELAVDVGRKLKIVLSLQIQVTFLSCPHKLIEEIKTYPSSRQCLLFALLTLNFDVSINRVIAQEVINDLGEKAWNELKYSILDFGGALIILSFLLGLLCLLLLLMLRSEDFI